MGDSGPYWTKLDAPGVSLAMDPPDGWEEGDTGTFYLLAEYETGSVIAPSEDGATCIWQQSTVGYIQESTLAECGTATVIDGQVITPPVPIFGWIGLKK